MVLYIFSYYMRKKIIFIYFLLIQVCLCQFGQNILQYEKFEWKYIQTKYFDILAYITKFM